MPIEQFTILNNGPIKRVSCDKVPALMVIAGPNGVGKSTLLETLKRNIPSIREANVQIKATASWQDWIGKRFLEILQTISNDTYKDGIAEAFNALGFGVEQLGHIKEGENPDGIAFAEDFAIV